MDNSILYMQQQAEQRVRRMQEQARRVLEQEELLNTHTSPHVSPHAGAQEPSSHPHAHAHLPAPPAHRHTHHTQANTILSGGSEQWMLLILALLLHQCGARPELLIALLYLAL